LVILRSLPRRQIPRASAFQPYQPMSPLDGRTTVCSAGRSVKLGPLQTETWEVRVFFEQFSPTGPEDSRPPGKVAVLRPSASKSKASERDHLVRRVRGQRAVEVREAADGDAREQLFRDLPLVAALVATHE
jgi:hypothetical protein